LSLSFPLASSAFVTVSLAASTAWPAFWPMSPASFTAAEAAADDATKASGNLDSELTGFKDSISSSDFSGADVKDSAIAKMRDLIAAADTATKRARDEEARVLGKAASAKADALKDTATALKLVKEASAAASAAVKEAGDIGQKAGWAVDEAKAMVTKADDAKGKLSEKVGDAGDQAPVLEAFISDLEGQATGVTEAADAAKGAIDDLSSAEGDLKTTADSLKTAAESSGPATVAEEAKTLDAGEATLQKTIEAIANVKAKVKTMMTRQAKLKAKIAAAEKKLK